MPKFELRRLSEYDDESLIREIQRVASLLPDGAITVKAFDALSRVESTTLRRRFGGWQKALTAAGLGHRYDASNRPKSKEVVIEELKRVAGELGVSTLSTQAFRSKGSFGMRAVVNAFGSWRAALAAAGLSPKFVRDWSKEECFENLLNVWSYYGRAPYYREMSFAPSHISGKVYAARWGSYTKALSAFVEFAEHSETETEAPSQVIAEESQVTSDAPVGPRQVPLGLRYIVLRRDRFRCVLCGASPATAVSCELHVDHIIPYSRSGPTALHNLRTLCGSCNIGKGSQLESAV